MKIEEIKIRLLELKKKSEQQAIHIENNELNEKRKEIVFRDNQKKTIKNSLGHMYVFLSLFYKRITKPSYSLFFSQGKGYKNINYRG